MTGACGNYFGTKVYSTHPKYGANFTVLLYDAATARPLAQFEANWLGQIRTGAVCGLAVDCIAPRRALSIGCIGSGFQAQSQLAAISAVREISSVRTWSRKADKREKFAEDMSGMLGIQVNVAESAEACGQADILITATSAKEPVIAAEAVRKDCLVLAMGSNYSYRREIPGEVVTSAQIVAEDLESCRIEAGDLLLALDDRDWKRIVELKQVVAGSQQISVDPERVTLFKSVGIGLEDVAVAAWIYEQSS